MGSEVAIFHPYIVEMGKIYGNRFVFHNFRIDCKDNKCVVRFVPVLFYCALDYGVRDEKFLLLLNLELN